MKGPELIPVEGFPLQIGAHIMLFGSAVASCLVFLLPAKLRPRQPDKRPGPVKIFQPDGWRGGLDIGLPVLTVDFEGVAQACSEDLYEGLNRGFSICQWSPDPKK